MPGPNGQQEAFTPDSGSTEVQNLLLSLGGTPVHPVMPGGKHVSGLLKCLNVFVDSDGYRRLSSDFAKGAIDRKRFNEESPALFAKMERQGAFKAHGLADGQPFFVQALSVHD